MFRVFVVDDEKPARQELIWLLDQCQGVDVVGQASSAKQAMEAMEALSPPVDLCFLDIDMPGLSGVRLAELWRDLEDDLTPMVVFVTAYEEYGAKAFSVDAVDYVLKPLRLKRLQVALARARRRRQGEEASKESMDQGLGEESSSPLERISVEEDGGYQVISVADILWIEADEGFATVRTEEGRFLSDFSLKELEEHLAAEAFFRCHRSYIIRLDAIDKITPSGAGTYRLWVEDGDEDEAAIPLSRSRAPELKARIPWSSRVLKTI